MVPKLHITWVLKDSRFLALRVGELESAPAPKADGRALKTGGKTPAKRLRKPVKAGSKRAAFIQWFLESGAQGRAVADATAHFGMSRPNVFAYWTNIHRDHGVGYRLEGGRIFPALPPGVLPGDIIGV